MADIGLAYGFPNSFSSLMHNKYKVGWTMFETTKCPSGRNTWAGKTGNWLDCLEDLDLLLSPSTYCKELFVKEGAQLPIEVVPLGVNIEMYPFIKRERGKKTIYFLNARHTNTKEKPWLRPRCVSNAV